MSVASSIASRVRTVAGEASSVVGRSVSSDMRRVGSNIANSFEASRPLVETVANVIADTAPGVSGLSSVFRSNAPRVTDAVVRISEGTGALEDAARAIKQFLNMLTLWLAMLGTRATKVTGKRGMRWLRIAVGVYVLQYIVLRTAREGVGLVRDLLQLTAEGIRVYDLVKGRWEATS